MERCPGEWGKEQGAEKELRCVPKTFYKGTTRQIRVRGGNNLKNNGITQARAQSAATRSKPRRSACACGRGQSGKYMYCSIFWEKPKSSFHENTLGTNNSELLYRTDEQAHVSVRCVSYSMWVRFERLCSACRRS